MVAFSNKKKMLFPIFITFFLLSLVSFADYDKPSDPVVQHNQTDSPYIVIGGETSGNYQDLNVLGEGLTYDIPEEVDNSNYRVEVWHNSSQISEGNINSINSTINFTTNISKDYSLQIYDFSNSVWVNCVNGNVPAETATNWWCNETSNPMNYNSSDGKIRIRINSTADSNAGLLKEDYVQYYVGYPSYLEVNLTNPSTLINIVQNLTFNLNATVVCKDGPCGEVSGTVMYNLSSSHPDTPLSAIEGEKPFFIQEIPANSKKSCGLMYSGNFCQLNWTINATGDVNSDWKIGVLFNSSYVDMKENSTENATVSIFPCTVDFNLSWSSIDFGLLDPNTGPHNASGNSDNEYNITVNRGSCNLDFYINGTDLTNTTLDSKIGVDNVTWSNTTNDYSESFNLSSVISVLKLNVPQNMNVTNWYWINVPSVYAGNYNGVIYVYGVENGQSFS
jgi:hypothetical protein